MLAIRKNCISDIIKVREIDKHSFKEEKKKFYFDYWNDKCFVLTTYVNIKKKERKDKRIGKQNGIIK